MKDGVDNSVHPLSRTMRSGGPGRRTMQTRFIGLDTRQCRACWKCIDACPQKVFGRINIIIHKHTLIVHGEKCTGCGKCVKCCEHGALYNIIKNGGLE